MAGSFNKEQARWKPGMMYAVPLTDGSYGLAQAGESMMENITYVALFKTRIPSPVVDNLILKREDAISLAATWKKSLNQGNWISLTEADQLFAKAEFPNENFSNSGYVGAKHHDIGILREFICAYHGFVPWNVMQDPTYYMKLLNLESEIPENAVLLSETDRNSYREKHN